MIKNTIYLLFSFYFARKGKSMKEKIDYEKIFEKLKDENNYDSNNNWIFLILILFIIGFGNKKEDKAIININLEGSDVNV